MLLSELNKVLPILKQGFYVKWQGKVKVNDYNGWHDYQIFANNYDFTKIQVIKCNRHRSYTNDFDFDLILKKL